MVMSIFLQLIITLALTANPSGAAIESFAGYQVETNGSASVVGGVLRLTPALNTQAGSAFINQPFTLTQNTSFSTAFQFIITVGTGVADGLVFILQSDANGPDALGGWGIDLGYSPISPSIAVEFDTWLNAGLDLDNNHIGIDVNGDLSSPGGQISVVPDLNSGSPVYAWVDYDGISNLLEVFVSSSSTKPVSPQLSTIVIIPFFLDSTYYAGFSAGTGGLNNTHDIENWTFASYEPSPVSVPTINEWGMIAFMLFAGFGAIYYLRRKRIES